MKRMLLCHSTFTATMMQSCKCMNQFPRSYCALSLTLTYFTMQIYQVQKLAAPMNKICLNQFRSRSGCKTELS